MSKRTVCVFCGSRDGVNPNYREMATALGAEIARRGWGLVFGGGRVGLMGAVADAALAGGAPVTGVIPEALWQREVGHLDLTELLVVGSMHERKQAMADRADGFIALPGGFGTFEEFFEVLTWAQLGFHRKPCVLLDVAGYWRPLEMMADLATAEGFVPAGNRDLMHLAASSRDALDLVERLQPLSVESALLPPEER
ncbi:MAG: TIGR00730 family Rossman fold protein [Thermomicrobiales bacterium]